MSVPQSLTIERDAAAVLAELRQAFQQVFVHLPAGAVGRPKDLQLLLGIEYKLCWQVLNIVRSEDPMLIAPYVPGITSVKKLLAAVRPLGVPVEAIADVETAMKSFGRVVAAHSDDRRGFDTMVASLSGGESAELIALQHRRDAFRSESQIWGSQVKTYVLQMIFRKAEHGSGYDRCYISSKYGLRTLRQNVMPTIHGHRDASSGSGPLPADQLQPLDVEAAKKYGASVLDKFCSQPIPKFKTSQHANGYIYSTLDADEIGRKSAVNMVFGGVVRNRNMERDEAGTPALLCGAAINYPTELVVVELMVHRPSFGDLTPEVRLHSTVSGADTSDPMGLTHQIQLNEEVEKLGPVTAVEPVPEAPAYERQLNYVFQKLNWDAKEYDLFRLRIAYPILHTRVRVVCPVPE